MSSEFLDPTHNFTPRQNPSKPIEPLVVQTKAGSFLPNLTDDELRTLAREKLSQALQAVDPVTQPELTRKIAAEVKDRLDGKPMQMQQSLIAVADVNKPLPENDRKALAHYFKTRGLTIETD